MARTGAEGGATTAAAAVMAALVRVVGKIAAMEVGLLQLVAVPTTMAVPVAAVVEPTTTVDMAEQRADRPIGAS
ncbi:MAG: hypothetical protein H8E93_02885 [Synechococcus sp.]|nr:hypothetical protein [Synechococcus sp.]